MVIEGAMLERRKVLNEMNSVEAMELLIERLLKTKTNGDFLAVYVFQVDGVCHL